MIWTPLLLADPSPCLRGRVLKDILGRPADDPEVRELSEMRDADPMVADLLAAQRPDGSWARSETAGGGGGGATSVALARLGYLGFGPEHPAVQKGAAYLFSRQKKDGAWPLPRGGGVESEGEGCSVIPLQTALPLKGLAACGYATDSRAERAYDWLIAQRLEDGAWSTGIASGTYRYVARYRRLAHSRWGCRSNTTGALSCLALHPERRSGSAARRALDLLLGRETREAHTLGYEVARLIGAESARGFLTFYARFDLAQILDLCWRVGAALADGRVAEMVDFVRQQQGAYGLWDYAPKPQASRWVTFDLLRSLSRLDESGDWVSTEPRTPFQVYAKQARRY